MKPESFKEFDNAVARFFQPFSERAGFPKRKLRDGIYEIAGQEFVMRIRRGTGHRKDFLVTLSRKASLSRDLDDLHSGSWGSVLTFDTKQGFIGEEGWRRASMIPFLGAELSISSSS